MLVSDGIVEIPTDLLAQMAIGAYKELIHFYIIERQMLAVLIFFFKYNLHKFYFVIFEYSRSRSRQRFFIASTISSAFARSLY